MGLNIEQMIKKSVSYATVSLLIFILLLMSMGGVFLLKSTKSDFKAPADDLSFTWHPDLFRILSFGHAPAAVDWLLIKFLGEGNILHVKPGVRAKVFYYLDLATTIDPAFFSLYTTGTSFLAVARNDKESALSLITKGESFRTQKLPEYPASFYNQFWREEWQIPFMKAYVHLFEFHDLVSSQVCFENLDQMITQGKSVPIQVQGLAQKATRPGGIYEIGMNVLTYLTNTTEDLVLKKEYQKKRESLFLSQYLAQLNDSYKKFKGSWRQFKNEHRIPDQDLWGGTIYLNAEGKVDSTTPRQKVLGIE